MARLGHMPEAMACGAAAVATGVGVDGDALRGVGIVVDPIGLDDRLRLAIRERLVERYSLERNVDALVDICRELAA